MYQTFVFKQKDIFQLKNIILLVVISLFNHTIQGQRQLDSVKAIEDFTIFKNILTEAHPALYEYISKDSLSHLFLSQRNKISDSTSDIDLYKSLATISSPIGDGHLQLFAPNTLKTESYYFPLILKIIDSEFYTDTEDFGIPIGSKIIEINGIKTTTILQKFKKYISSDGYNLTRKYRDIELKFGLYYAYEFGITKKFKIDYNIPHSKEIVSIFLDAEPFIKVRLRNAKRNSYFHTFHKNTDTIRYFEDRISNKNPYVYYKKDLKTAVLVVNSFSGDIKIFKSNLIKIFKEINKKKVEHLIIDVRNNDGGYRPNAIHLFSFITNKIFKQRTKEFVASLQIPEKDYVIKTLGDENLFLKAKFNQHPVIDGWEIKFDELETIMVPEKHHFNGKVYVLTSGTTFSAGTEFVLNAKNDPEIMILGEETGGGYYQHVGEFPVYYELPNSKIIMVISLEKIEHFVKDQSVAKGSGILPDKFINMDIKDLITGTDPLLKYLYQLIRINKN